MMTQKTCPTCNNTFTPRKSQKYCCKECRFWESYSRSTDPDACWIWQGYVHPDTGYGYVGAATTGDYRDSAHRHAWRLTHGVDPGEWTVMHTCDNRLCGHRMHLDIGTAFTNWMDAVNKGR